MCAGSNANCGLGRGRGVKGWRFIFPQLRSDTPAIEVAAACGLAGGRNGRGCMCVAAGCNTRGGVTSRDSEQITSLTTRYGLPRAAIVASVWRDSTAGSTGAPNSPRAILINLTARTFLSSVGSGVSDRLERSSGNFKRRMRELLENPENMVSKRVELVVAFLFINLVFRR